MFRYLKISKGSRGYQDASSRLEQPISRRVATSPQNREVFVADSLFALRHVFRQYSSESATGHIALRPLLRTHTIFVHYRLYHTTRNKVQKAFKYNLFSVFFHRHPHLILNILVLRAGSVCALVSRDYSAATVISGLSTAKRGSPETTNSKSTHVHHARGLVAAQKITVSASAPAGLTAGLRG